MKLVLAILLLASTVAIAQNVTAPAHPPYTKNLAQPVAQTKPVHTLSQTLAPMVTARAFVLAVASNQDVKDCTDQGWPASDACHAISLAIMRTFVQDKVAGKETPKEHPVALTPAPPINLIIPGVSVGDVDSQTGRVVKLSDDEYARLQKLRQAVADEEKKIAVLNGVDFGQVYVPAPCIAYDMGCMAWDKTKEVQSRPADHLQFRGQWLFINIPKAAQTEAK